MKEATPLKMRSLGSALGLSPSTNQPQEVLLLIDADNTLWDTNSVYAEAQLELLESIEIKVGHQAAHSEKLAFVREIDQLIASQHHLGLRYPPRLLIRAIEFALGGATPADSARRAWSQASLKGCLNEAETAELENAFAKALNSVPRLRRGVRNGLAFLRRSRYRMVMLTEGSLARVTAIADELSIKSFFERVLEAKKQPSTLKRIRTALGSPQLVIMIGDQFDRDIKPALQAGFKTVYFPGAFKPRWEMQPRTSDPDFVIDSFAAIAKAVSEIVKQSNSQKTR